MTCSSCKWFFQRKPQFGPVNSAQLGFCKCEGRVIRPKGACKQSYNGFFGQWPNVEHRCANWEEAKND